ncbi:hypothetical protein EVAR_55907_1 [Eumeta japonica]|uniref:Uncharacterized protein n=1 Tax=Eumeta variegata TaxID=151549 RepID=A0A4C1YLM7_EUMVA|nr:hypothetical protein EVAR_55907_1 [Eumeta japonica]
MSQVQSRDFRGQKTAGIPGSWDPGSLSTILVNKIKVNRGFVDEFTLVPWFGLRFRLKVHERGRRGTSIRRAVDHSGSGVAKLRKEGVPFTKGPSKGDCDVLLAYATRALRCRRLGELVSSLNYCT